MKKTIIFLSLVVIVLMLITSSIYTYHKDVYNEKLDNEIATRKKLEVQYESDLNDLEEVIESIRLELDMHKTASKLQELTVNQLNQEIDELLAELEILKEHIKKIDN